MNRKILRGFLVAGGLRKAYAALLGLFSLRRTTSTIIHIRIPLAVGITA